MANYQYHVEVLQIADVDKTCFPTGAALSLVLHFAERSARCRFLLIHTPSATGSEGSYRVRDKPFVVRSPHASDTVHIKLFAQEEGSSNVAAVATATEDFCVGGVGKDVGVRWVQLALAGSGTIACRVQLLWEVVAATEACPANAAAKADASTVGETAAVTSGADVGTETQTEAERTLGVFGDNAAAAAAATAEEEEEESVALQPVAVDTKAESAPVAAESGGTHEVLLAASPTELSGWSQVTPVASVDKSDPSHSPPSPNVERGEAGEMCHLQSTGAFCEADLSLAANAPPPLAGEEEDEPRGGPREDAHGTRKENITVVAKQGAHPHKEEEDGGRHRTPPTAGAAPLDDGMAVEYFDAVDESCTVHTEVTVGGDTAAGPTTSTAPPLDSHARSGGSGGRQPLNLYATSTQRGVPVERAYGNLFTVPAPALFLRKDARTGRPARECNTAGMLRARSPYSAHSSGPPPLHWMHSSALESLMQEDKERREGQANGNGSSSTAATAAAAVGTSSPTRWTSSSIYADGRPALQRLKEEVLLRAERKPVTYTWRK